MKKFIFNLSFLFFQFSLLLITPTVHSGELLIQPVRQQTLNWCWAAVSEMVLKYYKYPSLNPMNNYQCGVVAQLSNVCNQNCNFCDTTIGSTENMSNVLKTYQNNVINLVRYNYKEVRELIGFNPIVVNKLSKSAIKGQIDNYQPVVIAISPSGFGKFYPPNVSEHVALIVGYREDSNKNLWLKINDPAPYDALLPQYLNPYIKAGGSSTGNGSYEIRYENLVEYFYYKESIIFSAIRITL
ncbi:papain-like cysteine protease family protein [Vibrio parahaemolyticus]|uniref:papain-like cysteine protease family protein n=1 Tax=Vibrio parahaemolyticus TaxID=670 RepID=UPI000541DEB7|nr:papain-like cysteine protease family protein [Vibrio parahaemolyticus]EHR6473987.1 hypothetical protein [Vibrio parahaemolyticus]KHF19150.1 hypothetical protein PO81_15085 [Vibrio parahaemolyticus]MBE3685081.1 hypothetical protein [Vibrio parahaemolyticus]